MFSGGSLVHSFTDPYYTSTRTATDERWDVGLNGLGFVIDWESDRFRRVSVPMIRQQADNGERPGESSLNPEGLWRRTAESWHHGAGQGWADRADSDPFRFHASKGINPWDKHTLTLLNDTTHDRASLNANVALAVAGGWLYLVDGQQTLRRQSGAWAALTGNPSVTAESVCSDGQTVYVAYGASGIYAGTSSLSSYATGDVSLVRYAKGRLFAADGPDLYNVVAAGALPTALYTHDNPDWEWDDIAPGRGFAFAAGHAGDKSIVYRIGIKDDGSGLDVPIPAGELPDGEVCHSITGYLGFLALGTNLGVRFAAVDDGGNITLGALSPTPSPVLCGEGQDRFVWFGWSNFDGTSSGLGRLDLTVFITALTPAYASDLMATVAGSVTSVVTFDEKRVFTVAGSGVWAEDTEPVGSGWVTSGRAGFGIGEPKSALFMDLRHAPMPIGGSIALALATDDAAPSVVGEYAVAASTRAEPFGVNATGTWFEWTVTLAGGAELRRVTLRVDPGAERSEHIYVPLLLHCMVDLPGNVPTPVDVQAALSRIRGWLNARTPITYAEGEDSWRVAVDDLEWVPYKRHDRHLDGTLVVKLKTL